MNPVVECDNCGQPATFHYKDAPCFEGVEHLCRVCYDAETERLWSRDLMSTISGDRAIHGPIVLVRSA